MSTAEPIRASGYLCPDNKRHEDYIMKKKPTESGPSEPLGIIISNGSRQEVAPRFSAYVWAPAPEVEPAETNAGRAAA